MSWTYGPDVPIRHDWHFEERVMPCFARRPSGSYETFARAVADRSDAEELIVGNTRLSCAAHDQHANVAAAGLARRGLVSADWVVMLLSNRVESPTTLLAALRLGAIVVPIGTRLQTPEIAYIVAHSGAAVLVHDAELALRPPSPAEVLQLRLRVAVGEPGNASKSDGAAEGRESFAALCIESRAPPVHSGAQDPVAAILYTSGTTSKSKCAMFAQLNFAHPC